MKFQPLLSVYDSINFLLEVKLNAFLMHSHVSSNDIKYIDFLSGYKMNS